MVFLWWCNGVFCGGVFVVSVFVVVFLVVGVFVIGVFVVVWLCFWCCWGIFLKYSSY